MAIYVFIAPVSVGVRGTVEPAIPQRMYGLGSGSYVYAAGRASVACVFSIEAQNVAEFEGLLNQAGLAAVAEDAVSELEYVGYASALEAVKNPPTGGLL